MNIFEIRDAQISSLYLFYFDRQLSPLSTFLCITFSILSLSVCFGKNVVPNYWYLPDPLIPEVPERMIYQVFGVASEITSS